MTVDPGLMAIAPDESKRVISNLLDVAQLEVTALHVPDRPFVPLAMRTGTEASKQLVRERALVPVGPVDLHDAGAARRAKLNGFERVLVHEIRPSHLPEAASVRSRTLTVA